MLRSRCRDEEMGEKPSTFFILEKRNFTNKAITKLIDDGSGFTNTSDIYYKVKKSTNF